MHRLQVDNVEALAAANTATTIVTRLPSSSLSVVSDLRSRDEARAEYWHRV